MFRALISLAAISLAVLLFIGAIFLLISWWSAMLPILGFMALMAVCLYAWDEWIADTPENTPAPTDEPSDDSDWHTRYNYRKG